MRKFILIHCAHFVFTLIFDALYTAQLRLCRELSIANGLVSYDSPYIPGRVASISCHQGFSLVGNSELTCTNSGWSGTTPNCACECSLLSAPSGNYFLNLNSTHMHALFLVYLVSRNFIIVKPRGQDLRMRTSI